jgi:tetratricopeptide (TPR) repeat protein
MHKGRTDEARALLLAHLEGEPRAIAERRLLIRVEAFRGQLGEVERQARALADVLGAGSPLPWIELGHALEIAHRYDEALDAYDRAAEVAPQDPAGPRTGGLRAARWGELELAEPRLAEALRRDPRDATTWHALGFVRLAGGELGLAEQAYRSGLLADPGRVENRVGLATVALARGDMKSALAEYDALAAARPQFADAELGRAYALMMLARYAEAEQALARAARLGASSTIVAAQRSELARRTSAYPSGVGGAQRVSPLKP